MACFGCCRTCHSPSTPRRASLLCWRRQRRLTYCASSSPFASLIREYVEANHNDPSVFIVPFSPTRQLLPDVQDFNARPFYHSSATSLNDAEHCGSREKDTEGASAINVLKRSWLRRKFQKRCSQRPTSLAVNLVTSTPPASRYMMQRTSSDIFATVSPFVTNGNGTMRSSSTVTTPLSTVSSGFDQPQQHANGRYGFDYNEKLNALQAFSTTSHSGSIAKHFRMHKLPQPQRCEVVFNALDDALKQCMAVTQQDIESLREQLHSLLSAYSENEQQLKAAERYLKRLEFHWSRIEELRDVYESQLASVPETQSPSVVKKRHQLHKSYSATNNFKGAFKDLVQVLCKLEAELEMISGTLNVEVKGVAGFARLAPGDVFEVQLKCGAQKWKSKVKIGSDKKQTWDAEMVIFKCMVEDFLEIKVFEQKGFGKSILLIEKTLDPVQLFRAHPQLITLDLNRNGSIKLSLQSNWNPLDGLLTPLTTASDLAHSSLTLNGALKSTASISSLKRNPKIDKSSNPDLALAPSSITHFAGQNGGSSWASTLERGRHVNVASRDTSSITNTPPSIAAPISRSNCNHSLISLKNWGLSAASSPNISLQSSSDRCAKINLAQLLRRLKPIVHSAASRFQDLCQLETIIFTLDCWLAPSMGNGNHRINRASTAECLGNSNMLDYIRKRNNDADDLDDNVLNRPSLNGHRGQFGGTHARNGNGEAKRGGAPAFDLAASSSPSSSASSSSPFNQDTRRRRYLKKGEETPAFRSHSSSLDRPRSAVLGIRSGDVDGEQLERRRTRFGEPDLDVCLYHHLIHCEILLQKLAAFGPLHHCEQEALCKLTVETSILTCLVPLANPVGRISLPKITQLLNDLDASTELQDVWLSAVGSAPEGYHLPASVLRQELRRAYGHIVRAKYEDLVDSVLDKVIHLLTDRSTWEPDIITVFQFVYCFHDKQLVVFIESVAHETWIVETINCRVRGKIQRVMDRLKHVPVPPPPDVIRHVGIILVDESPDLRPLAESYLLHAQGALWTDLANTYLAYLEHEDAETRRGACRALAVLNARRCMSALAFVSHNDRKAVVREEARRAVASFGFITSGSVNNSEENWQTSSKGNLAEENRVRL